MSDGQVEFHKLMERLGDRDPDAVEEFLAKYRDDLYRVVRRWLHQRLRAQFDSVDFLQSVWGTFFAIPTDQLEFTDSSALRAFLLDLAANKVIDAFRSRMQTQCRNLNRERSLHGSAKPEVMGLMGPDPTPSQDVMAQEAWEKLVQGLPDTSQTVLNMLREGRSHREIARQLSVSERTIGRLVHKMNPRTAS